MDLIRFYLTPSLDRDPDAAFNRNLLRGCLMLIAAAALARWHDPGAVALALMALLGAYEAFLFSRVPTTDVAEDSALDFAGGVLGSAAAWAWLDLGWGLGLALGVAMVAVPFVRSWVVAQQVERRE